MTFYHRAPWLERLTGMHFIWATGPYQPWLPFDPPYVVVQDDGR
jgi:hypothetical protein